MQTQKYYALYRMYSQFDTPALLGIFKTQEEIKHCVNIFVYTSIFNPDTLGFTEINVVENDEKFYIEYNKSDSGRNILIKTPKSSELKHLSSLFL